VLFSTPAHSLNRPPILRIRPEYYEALFGTDTEREMDFLIETHGYFRTYDLARTRRLVRRAGMRVVEVFDFDYQVDVPRKRG
jgi:hypothetical protein